MTTICLIPGDGVGQEVIPAAARVLAADPARPAASSRPMPVGIAFERCGHGAARGDRRRASPRPTPRCSARPSHPSTVVAGYRSPILALRKQFDLYANLRPTVTLLPGQPAVDLLIVRENTEGLYSGRERREGDTAIAERVITRAASERIARVGFEQARRRVTLQSTPSHGRITHPHAARMSPSSTKPTC